MNTAVPASRMQLYAPLAAVLAYVLALAVLVLVVVQCVVDVGERYREVANLTDMLSQLNRRATSRPSLDPGVPPTGAPFLEGETQAVAGAALLQRVSTAVAKVKGTIQSSQVELDRGKGAEGMTTLTASCEIPEPMLQAFLYDLEAGMPFLFIDSLVAQVPQGAGADSAPIRVLIEMSGQWRREP